MPRSERDEVLTALTSRIFSAMLDELVMDAALQSHHEVARSRVVCAVCNTRCGSVHTPGNSTNNEASTSGNVASRAATPSSATGNEFAAAKVNGTSTPSSSKDGNLYLECVICQRQIASNRYAPHLANCMGLSSARRGAVRGNAKPKQPSEAGRSASPMSEDADMSDDKTNGKSKGKTKLKKTSDEIDFSLNANGKRKRPGSPQISPNKKSKKGKVSGSPVSRVKSDPDPSGLPSSSHYSPSTTSQSKIPSKLRDSSTTSFLERSSTSSRESSPEAVPTPTSSFSSQSPSRPLVKVNGKPVPKGRPLAMGTGPPKRPSPPRPQPVHVPDYDEIDHANETGSSTDTDSD